MFAKGLKTKFVFIEVGEASALVFVPALFVEVVVTTAVLETPLAAVVRPAFAAEAEAVFQNPERKRKGAVTSMS
jgi:hypothetical protein